MHTYILIAALLFSIGQWRNLRFTFFFWEREKKVRVSNSNNKIGEKDVRIANAIRWIILWNIQEFVTIKLYEGS